MSRILITGGNGFIGKHTTDALIQEGHEVIVSGRTSEPSIDLLAPHAPTKLIKRVRPDILIHLAWETTHGEFWHAESNRAWLKASTTLLDEFLNQGGTRAVFAGSCAEYDWTQLNKTGVANETTTPLNPATPYGQSKVDLYTTCCERIKGGASIAWGRLFLLYGSHEHPNRLVSSIIQNLLAGKEAPMSSGKQVRDLMYAADAGNAFADLALSPITGAINIASGNRVSLKDVGQKIAQLLDREDLLKIGALPDRPNDPPALVAHVGRLTREVGFSPSFDLSRGLELALKYWRTKV